MLNNTSQGREENEKTPSGSVHARRGLSFQRNREKTKGECVAHSGASFPKKRVIQGRQSCMGFAEECVKLIRKIWFREVLDISNNEIIITDFQPSVKS